MSLLLTPTEGKNWMGAHTGEGANPGHSKSPGLIGRLMRNKITKVQVIRDLGSKQKLEDEKERLE